MKIKSGFIALFAKLGPKLVKLLKVIKGLKFLGAAGSMAAYSWMFSWQMAITILTLLFVHEYGHIWAMKRTGMKTKGIYFIPFFGGAAVPDEDFKTREQEAYVALMGPVFGLGLTLMILSLFFISHNNMWAGISAWMALVNAFQFLPIHPMDGGRIVKSVCMSIDKKLGYVMLLGGFLLALWLLIHLKIYLFALLLPVGILEILLERKSKKVYDSMSWQQIVKYVAFYAIVLSALIAIMFFAKNIPGAKEALQVIM
jgi:putative peptide zinc metalloprotease protein